MSNDKFMRSMLLVVNPKAGTCEAKKVLFDLVYIFSKGGFNVSVYPTRKTGTSEYVRVNSPRYDTVVCCGGDGTLSEVLDGIFRSGKKTPVGYIPMGSTNDFARTLNIPKNPKLAALAIINGTPTEHDLGSINGSSFSYIAATGAFTGASYSASQKLKNSLGHFAYILEGAKYLLKIKPFPMAAEFNGKKIKGDYIYVSVSNTTSVGGLVKFDKKDVCFDDGTFELVMVKKPRNILESGDLITALLSNKLSCSCVKLYHTARVRMLFDSPTCFTADGEERKESKNVIIQNHNKAVKLILPNKKLF